MRRHKLPAVLVSVVAASLLVGCGGSDNESAGPQSNGVAQLEPDQILEKSKAAAKAASSVHLKGSVNDSEGATSDSGTAVDLRYNRDAGTVGTLTENGQSFQLVLVGHDVFLKASGETWTALTGDDRAGDLLGDRWVKIPPQAPGFEAVATLATFNRFIEKALTPGGALTKTAIKTVRGLNVVGVVEKANNETLYIATEGEPYPVQVQSDTGQGALDFLEWNQPVDGQAPQPDQVVDLSKLTGK
jgi:hypothetical protein